MLDNTVIYTKRLEERPMNIDDFQVLYENYDKDAEYYMDLFPAGNEEKLRDFIELCIKEMKEETDLHLIINDKITKKFIGYIGIYYLKENAPEIGIWINKESQHCGYGKEAMESVIKWIDDNYKFSYMRYPVDKDNIFSRKLPEYFNGKIEKEYSLKSCSGRTLNLVEYWIKK
ncbi:GNAT family N-acetyltransferase [uncultured Clostridium sp.]|uniref:GNAT family N-acetyltransferase n=1 Tax=uncultured Clostridium sp. TaxID=59620 RepID=UPI0025D856C1|nr:GNAT family N-acetyltransferase [uncultured Clostridium sp.]